MDLRYNWFKITNYKYKGVIIILKRLKKMNDILSSRKGAIICGVVLIIAIGGLMGQKVYKAKEAAKVEAIQIAKKEAETKKAQDLYAKQKADAEAKRLAEMKAIEDAEAAEVESQIVRGNRPVEAIYDEIHTMANTIVIASDYIGYKIITKENIFALSNEIQK